MTKKAAVSTTKSARGKAPYSLGVLGVDFLNTTWRIVVPVVVFVSLGIFADIQLHTKPWLTIVAVIVGFAVAGWLVKRLLSTVDQEDKK